MADLFNAGITTPVDPSTDLPLPDLHPADQARASMSLAVGSDPDYEAELRNIAAQTGVPVDSARADTDYVKQRATIGSIDFGQMARDFPNTAKFLGVLNNAQVAHDDVPALTGTEGALSQLNGPYLQQGPAPSYKERALNWMRNLFGMAPLNDVRDEGAAARAFIADTARRDGTTVHDLRQAVGGMSDVPMQFTQGFMNSASAGLATDQAGDPTTGSGQVARGLGDLAGFIAGAPLAAGKFIVGKTVGSALDVAEGSSILKAAGKDILHQALTLGAASAIGATGQALNTNNAQDLLKAYGRAGLSGAEMGATFGAAGRLLPDNTLLQTFGRVLGVNAALDLQNGTNPLDNRSLEQKVMDYGLNTLFAFRGAGRPGGSWLQDAAKADIASQDGQALQQLNEMAGVSKLRQRDPAAFQDFIKQATEDGPVQDVYVDPKTFTETLAQSGVDPAEVAAKVPSVGEQLAEASITGRDLRIPVDEFATHMAGEEYAQGLIQHLKTDPNGMSQAEAQEFMQSHADRLQQDVERVLTAKQGDTAFNQSADAVKAKILDQLQQANRFKPDVHDAYASMMSNFYKVNAARMGIIPEALYEQHPVTIRAEHIAGDNNLNQDTGKNRGSFNPDTKTISLLKNADLSTFLHESGHFYLEVMHDLAGRAEAPQSIKGDLASLHKWFGVKDRAAWDKMTLDEKRPFHEQFARGFEGYLFEGKSPSVEMQGLFQRFRAWLLSIYKSFKSLNVELTPEVRGVFDRMLATSEQIKEAEAARSFAPMFATAEEAGMSPDEWRAYQDLGNRATQDAISQLEARSLRDMQWLSNAKAKILRGMQKDAAEKRKAIRREVEDEVNVMPVYQAMRFLKHGEVTNGDEDIKVEAGHRLNIDALKEMYPPGELAEHPDWQKLGYGGYGMLSADGLHPDLVAEMFGFQSGDALVHALLDAEPRRSVIDAMTDQRMLERHGDLTDAVAMDRAAEQAIHNEARARFIATEMNALNKATGKRRLLATAAREFAQNMIARLKIRDVKPGEYTAAEARAARNADRARKNGDLETAAAEKRNQLIHNYAAKAAMDAQSEIEKGLNYLNKFNRARVREGLTNDYLDQIDALLERFDLRKGVSLRAIDRRQSLLEWAQSQQDQGYEPAVSQDLLDEANRQHYKDMTVESFRGLVDTVKSIEHLGRLKQRLLDLKDQREFDAVVDEAVNTIRELPQKDHPDPRNPGVGGRGLDKMNAKWLNTKSIVRSADASLLKMEQMLDWLDHHNSNGVMNRIVFRRLAEAGARENDLLKDLTAKMRALGERMPKDAQKDLNTRYEIPELIDSRTGRPSSMLKSEIIAMALNTGNESNLHKLVNGERWDPADVARVLDRHMTKDDWDFVQGVWDTIEHLWPEIEAMERRLGNTAPEKVVPRPVQTPYGEYRGGYFPMVYDPLRSFDVDQRNERAGDKMFENTYTRAGTRKGHIEMRNEDYARPLLLSLDVIPRHLTQVVHDLAYREAIIDADRFLSDKRIRGAIEGALGREYYAQLRPWLQSIANDRNVDNRGLGFWDRMAHGARTTSTLVGLGFRLSTMMIHGTTALSNSIGEIGPRWMASGTRAFFGSPKKMAEARDFIFERSAEMRHRMNEVDRDVRDALRDMALHGQTGPMDMAAKGLDAVKRTAYFGISMLDMGSALPTWMGAYNKSMHEGMSEQDAVYAADKAVRNAHGGGGAKDLAAIQRGNEFQKLFTMFYSFWNHFYNRQRDMLRTAAALPGTIAEGEYKKAAGDFGMLLARSFFYFVIPQLIHASLKPPAKNQDDHQHWASWAAEEIALGIFSGIPVMRDIASSAFTGRDYAPTPAAGFVTNTGKSAKDIAALMKGQQVSDHWLQHAITSAGYAFGLPTGQAATSAQFLWDVSNGKEDPQGLSEWLQGIAHGRIKH